MAYDPQRSRPRKPVSEDEPAPVDAILDEIADEAEADAAERAGMADVVEALVEEIVEDEAIIDALAAQPPVEVVEVVDIDEEIVAVVDASPQLPDGVEIEVRDDEVVVHTAGADVEVAASGTDVIVHTDDADVDVNTSDDVVVVSTVDYEIVVDVSPPSTDYDVDIAPSAPGRARQVVLVGAVVALLAALFVWLRRLRRTTD